MKRRMPFSSSKFSPKGELPLYVPQALGTTLLQADTEEGCLEREPRPPA